MALTDVVARELVHHLNAAVLVEDTHGRAVLANDAFARMFGRSGSQEWGDAKRSDVLDAVSGRCQDRSTVLSDLTTIADAGERCLGYGVELVNGHSVSLDFVPIKDRTTDLGVLWYFRDITEFAATQHELRERNRVLTEAAELNNHFLAAVSHELRTPLTAVTGFAERLREQAGVEPLARAQQVAVEAIARNVDRLMRLGQRPTVVDPARAARPADPPLGHRRSRARPAGRGLVLLYVGVPEMVGWTVLERIRDIADVPVLMLSAHSQESDKVCGLRTGADDYVTKPFAHNELLARVEALLRRSGASRSDTTATGGWDKPYDDGVVRVDPRTRNVEVDGKQVELTNTEFRLLNTLVRHAGAVLSAKQLLQRVWDDPTALGSERVKFAVLRLRRKLGWSTEQSPIRAVRGVGYRYRTYKPAHRDHAAGFSPARTLNVR